MPSTRRTDRASDAGAAVYDAAMSEELHSLRSENEALKTTVEGDRALVDGVLIKPTRGDVMLGAIQRALRGEND